MAGSFMSFLILKSNSDILSLSMVFAGAGFIRLRKFLFIPNCQHFYDLRTCRCRPRCVRNGRQFGAITFSVDT